MANASWLHGQRTAAWGFGRQHTDHLLRRYQELHKLDPVPPPALIARELVRDVLDVRLYFDPLPMDRYAEVRLVDGRPQITVNSEIASMPDVRDAIGVENVAILHEIMHIERDLSSLFQPPSFQFEGFDDPPGIVCLRAASDVARSGDVARREFWAEEAGRAGAVSIPHLREVDAFQELMALAGDQSSKRRTAWPLLYQSAEAIGVNSTALKKQLQFEGFVSVESGELIVQPTLGEIWR